MGEWGVICHVYSKCSVGYILTLRLRILCSVSYVYRDLLGGSDLVFVEESSDGTDPRASS